MGETPKGVSQKTYEIGKSHTLRVMGRDGFLYAENRPRRQSDAAVLYFLQKKQEVIKK